MVQKKWVPNPAERMQQCIQDSFFKDTLGALRDANRIAATHCKDLAPEWRIGAFANHRREHFNQLWAPVARKHGGLARPVLNRNFATSHLEVTLGGVIFTPVAVQSPGEFPKDAEYRRSLATSNQTSMFRGMGMADDEPDPEANLYALFAYSSDADEDTSLPLFAHVGFPEARKRRYVQTYSLTRLISELGQLCSLPGSAPPPEPQISFAEEVIPEVPLRMIREEGARKSRK